MAAVVKPLMTNRKIVIKPSQKVCQFFDDDDDAPLDDDTENRYHGRNKEPDMVIKLTKKEIG